MPAGQSEWIKSISEAIFPGTKLTLLVPSHGTPVRRSRWKSSHSKT